MWGVGDKKVKKILKKVKRVSIIEERKRKVKGSFTKVKEMTW